MRAFYFDNGPDYVQNGLMRYTNDNSLVGFANSKGQIKIPALFTIAYPFNHGYSIVGQGSHLEPLFPGETEHMVWRGGKWGIIDRRGNILVPIQYDALNPVRENDKWLEAVRGSEKFLITHTGRRLSSRAYSTYNHLPDTTGARRPWQVDNQKGWGNSIEN
ncbi:WG repeat-containing protein [Hymenobacter sp. 102]|uniref:WG repeat-containing protein n=1 Tax=Hymenobacter sp. 102 TaxID=3403152 RepID=UPI003CF51C11